MPAGYKDLLNTKNEGPVSSPKDVLRKYIAYLPLFIICLLVFAGAAFLYIKYTTPKFRASTLILVKNENKNNSSVPGSGNSNELLTNAMNGLGIVNLDNELLRLRSSGLIKGVVEKNGFNISYYLIGKIRRSDVYLDAPFRVIPKSITDSSELELTFSQLNAKGATLSYTSSNEKKSEVIQWNSEFMAGGKKFSLIPVSTWFEEKSVYEVEWKPVSQTAGEILNKFSVGTSGERTTIIELSILIENLNRGKDILDAIASEFRQSNVEELNKVALNTIQFIDDRLAIVSGELDSVEGGLESYKGSNKVYDLAQQSTQSFQNSDAASKNINDIKVQQRVVDMIQQSLKGNGKTKLIASTLGIADPTLNNLVSRYNELQLKKEREAPDLGEQSMIIKDLNSQINDLKTSIGENLQTLSKALELQESNMQNQNGNYNQMITSLPRKERLLQEIKRQQNIKEGLFLYLLQKREEAAISRTSGPSNYEQIDPASGYGPVEPNSSLLYRLALALGLILPVGFIYLKDLFNDRINTREDILKKTAIPIIGDIGHIKKIKRKILPALDQNLTGEQFRTIRSSVAFSKEQYDKQVILVTSTTSGEGKSFISLNLAAVLAKAGKKVALLEFDLRKPHDKNLPVDQAHGLTDYLAGDLTLPEIGQPVEQLPNLHIYPAGPFVADSADLLLSEKIKILFQQLKYKYDVLVINSAPAGLVSDAFVLGEYAGATLYVIRQKHTKRKQLGFIDDISRLNKLNNVCLVFNDVRTDVKLGYEGYGYSQGNHYYNGHMTKKSIWRRKKNTVNSNPN
jgi:capsular exopolysaccharide synthesis family protein